MDVKMKPTDKYILIQNRGGKSTDWARVCSEIPKRAILIVDVESKKWIDKQDYRHELLSVHSLNEFSLKALSALVESYVKKFGASNLNIYTNHEDDVENCAALRGLFSIKGPSINEIMPYRNKLMMKDIFRSTPEILPKYLEFMTDDCLSNPSKYYDYISSYLGLPFFKKPIDGAGSKNSGIIRSYEEFCNWIKDGRDKDGYELDEFIKGNLYHCDSFVVNGKILDSLIGLYLSPNADFFNGMPLGSISIGPLHPDYDEIITFNRRVLSTFPFVPDGMFHLELFKTEHGELKFLEIACRPPGAHVPALHKNQADIEVRAEHFITQISGNAPHLKFSGNFYATFWFPTTQGFALGLRSPDHIKSEYSIKQLFVPGEMKAPASFADHSIEMVMFSDNWNTLYTDFISMAGFLPVVMA